MAYRVFFSLFRDKIIDLTSQFPQDAKTEGGEPFWTGHKKFPTALRYDPHNLNHVEFVAAATNLFACMLKVHPAKHPSELNDPSNRWMAEYRDRKWINTVVASLQAPEYVKGVVSDLEDATGGAEQSDEALEAAVEQLLQEIEQMAANKQNKGLLPLDFEKDDDDNFHVSVCVCFFFVKVVLDVKSGRPFFLFHFY